MYSIDTINFYNLIFGNQSPLLKIENDSEIKEELSRLIVNNSIGYKKRSFRTYMLSREIFKEDPIEINVSVKTAIGRLLNPFITRDIRKVEEKILDLPKQRYSQEEVFLTQQIAKATGVKNTYVVVTDTQKENLSACHGIITYINTDMSLGTSTTIDAGWSNGFFTFKNADNLSIFIAIPKQYLASLILHTVPNTNMNIGNSMDDVALRGILTERFLDDLIKSFFSAIFSDGSRAIITSDILLINHILKHEGAFLSATSEEDIENNPEGLATCLDKYADLVRQLKSSENCESLILHLMYMASWRSIILNPIIMYSGFVDTPYAQIRNMFENIKKLSTLSENYTDYTFSNNFSDMNVFLTVDKKNPSNLSSSNSLIVFGLNLIRFLPFAIFVNYYISGGAFHNEMKTILEDVDKYKNVLLGWRASNPQAGAIVDFIVKNLTYVLEELYPQLSSPLNVTDRSKKIILRGVRRIIEDKSIGETHDEPRPKEPIV